MRNEIEREREKSSAERHSLASQLEQATRESKDLSALLRERDEVMLFTLTKTGLQFTLISFFCLCHSLRRRANADLNARNVNFRISLRWPIHIINPVGKTL